MLSDFIRFVYSLIAFLFARFHLRGWNDLTCWAHSRWHRNNNVCDAEICEVWSTWKNVDSLPVGSSLNFESTSTYNLNSLLCGYCLEISENIHFPSLYRTNNYTIKKVPNGYDHRMFFIVLCHFIFIYRKAQLLPLWLQPWISLFKNKYFQSFLATQWKSVSQRKKKVPKKPQANVSCDLFWTWNITRT